MNLQEIKENIEDLKIELGKLIEKGASFNEVYNVSLRLDKLITVFYKHKSGEIN